MFTQRRSSLCPSSAPAQGWILHLQLSVSSPGWVSLVKWEAPRLCGWARADTHSCTRGGVVGQGVCRGGASTEMSKGWVEG